MADFTHVSTRGYRRDSDKKEGQPETQVSEERGGSKWGCISMLDKTHEFFQTCDIESKGYITRTDMRRLHKELPLSEEELENVFDSLDSDKNGYLTMGEFSSGFSDFLHGRKILKVDDQGAISKKTLEAVYQNQWDDVLMENKEEDRHFGMLLESLGATNIFEEPSEVRSLWAQLRKDEPHLLSNFEEFLARVTYQIKDAQQEKKEMESALQRKTALHDSEIRRLYEEMEQQIKNDKDGIILKDSERLLSNSQDLQEQLSTKEQELELLFQKQRRLERQCQDLYSDRQVSRVQSVKLKITNEELLRELNHTTHELTMAQEQLTILQEQASRLQQEREMEMYRVTEGLHREKQSLMKQLDLLREMNKHLRDERDITSLKSKPSFKKSSRKISRIPSLKRAGKNHSFKSVGATEEIGEKMENNGKDLQGGPTEARIGEGPDAGGEGLDAPPGGWPLRRVISIEEDHLPHLLQGETPPLLHQLSEEDEDEVQQEERDEEEGNTDLELNSTDPAIKTPQQFHHPALVPIDAPTVKGMKKSRWADKAPSSPRGQPVGKETYQQEQMESALLVPDRLFKVILVGNSSVGKTALLRRFCEGRFHRATSATVGVDYSVRTLNLGDINVALQLWDTAGQERYRSITKQFFRRVDGVVVIYDITVEESFHAVRPWLCNIQEAVGDDIPIMVLGNKMDMESEREVSLKEGHRLAEESHLIFYEVSAYTGYNIMESLIHLARVLRETEDHEKEITVQLSTPHVKKKSCCK
ncbi:EF-hand calcium-binding domain-containing protein 4B [Alosa alosa]|uniref:EF-hand calcium-binding domain-containing protein 4B n=1 Tax=Alosa alosa TaxID=278164 RepID=UPI0020154542|nr:EF-hand calcium-binding domain-containing protein 4B [Alosa alosa]